MNFNGIYIMNKKGMRKVRDGWSRLFAILLATSFISVGFGYLWRCMQ